MSRTNHAVDESIEWERIFERIVGSREAPVSQHMLARHLEHTHDLTGDEAWGEVEAASDSGDLLVVIVEWFPDVFRRFYFIPRIRFEDAGSVFVPFWSYVCDTVYNGNGCFSRAAFRDRIQQRAESTIPDHALEAVDDHLEALAPVLEPTQSMRETVIRRDISEFYEQLASLSSSSRGPRPYESETVHL